MSSSTTPDIHQLNIEESPLFCYQCEQTIGGRSCTIVGRCTKTPEVAALQDHLIVGLKRLAIVVQPLWNTLPPALKDSVKMKFVTGLFSTLTNVSFDPADFKLYVTEVQDLINELSKLGKSPAPSVPSVAAWCPTADQRSGRIDRRQRRLGETVTGLQELIVYGMKGIAAYADHAHRLGLDDPKVDQFFVDALAFLATEPTNVPDLLAWALRTGEHNLLCMDLLHRANTTTYGDPVPTKVKWAPFDVVPGKAILVSGHDLWDLRQLLELTKDSGIQVYTHGEMLPAHGYPGLNKYPHLAGHYGTAWQNQKKEFAAFPGSIMMTTNCIIPPPSQYSGRIFTLNTVGCPGLTHLPSTDFQPAIEAALRQPGFTAPDATQASHLKELTVGFGLKTVAGVADALLGAVKAGKLRRIFLIGGCDGFEGSRNYYTELAAMIPRDCLILTLACGKFKLNHLDLGTIEIAPGVALPRLIDIGQCNDAHVGIEVVKALAGMVGCSPNELPLSIVLSWFEQKAVAILLSLLALGIRNIRVGPALPAFLSSDALAVLVEKYALTPIKTPKDDLEAMLAGPK